MRWRLWHALTAAAAIVVIALVAMAAALALSLTEAGALLNRLNRSQEQLAVVTQIQGEIGRLQGAETPQDLNRLVGDVSDRIVKYRQSIADETKHLDLRARDGQLLEVTRGTELESAFSVLQSRLASASFERDI